MSVYVGTVMIPALHQVTSFGALATNTCEAYIGIVLRRTLRHWTMTFTELIIQTIHTSYCQHIVQAKLTFHRHNEQPNRALP